MNKKKLSGFFGALAVAAAALVARNNLGHKPSPPPASVDVPAVPTYTLVVHVCYGDCALDDKVVGATVDLAAGQVSADQTSVAPIAHLQTDAAGNGNFDALKPGGYTVCASVAGYLARCVAHNVPAEGDVYLGLEADVPPVLPVHVDGKVFRDATGAIWPWAGVTSFTLLKRFVDGQDIGPYLDHRRAAGANLVRVLTTMKNIVDFPPTAYTDAQLGAFLAAVHAHGLRVELVALADAQTWSVDAQRRQVQRIVDAAAAAGGLDPVEVANEPFQNSAKPEDLMRGVSRRPGVLMASGDYDVAENATTLFHLDYVTTHSPRDDEWPRKAKELIDLREGFGWANGSTFHGLKVPVVADEPIGADEVNQPGRRATNADDFYWFAAVAQTLGAGATFHSTAGITADEPGPVQAAAEAAFFSGLRAVPPEAQTGLYTRGLLASCPLVHDDAKALRTFCALRGGVADCVVIRPTGAWSALARDGWRIERATGPRGTVLRLTR
jgi:hypothetical protein